MKKDSIKYIKINNEIQKELSIIIKNRIKDPRVSSRLVLTKAIVTTDLKECKVYVSITGNEEEKNNTINGLNSAKGFIRKELSSSLNLRNTPSLSFFLDNASEYASHIEELIRKINSNE